MHESHNSPIFSYIIDSQNQVIAVNRNWTDFARENQAEALNSDAVLGRPLFNFIAGDETRHLYTMIIERVRRTGQTLLVPFRCDAPSLRRFMQLIITPLENVQLQFSGELLREEPRDPVALLDTGIERSKQFLTICSWCKQINLAVS